VEDRPDHIKRALHDEDNFEESKSFSRYVGTLPQSHRPSRLMSRTIELPEERPRKYKNVHFSDQEDFLGRALKKTKNVAPILEISEGIEVGCA
jgi:hypothetical protein